MTDWKVLFYKARFMPLSACLGIITKVPGHTLSMGLLPIREGIYTAVILKGSISQSRKKAWRTKNTHA